MEESNGPSKPRRPPSHAKRHFESIVESRLTKWKCKYCTMTYGEKTATSNLWRHLENKHRQNIGVNDQRQSMAIRKCKFGLRDNDEWSSMDECNSSKPLKPEEHACPFPNTQQQNWLTKMALQRSDVMASTEFCHCPLANWESNPCSKPKYFNRRVLQEHDSGHADPSLTIGNRIQETVHRILSTRPDFVDFFNDPQVAQLMPEVNSATVDSAVKTLVTSMKREIIGQLKKHDGGLHLIIEVVKIADRPKIAVQVSYEELSDSDGHMASQDEEDNYGLLSMSKARMRHCPLVILDIYPEISAQEHCTRILKTLETFHVKNRLLTVTTGQSCVVDTLVEELPSKLRDMGIYTINSYATVDSIRDGLYANLEEFREFAVDIRNAAAEILNFLEDGENQKTSKASKRIKFSKMAVKVKTEVDRNDLLLRTLRWDLMPILPHLKSVGDFLSKSRALGVAYNFNSGCNWKRLNQVLQEVSLNLKNGCQGPNQEDHQKLLRTLLKKMSAFPESCERVIRFLWKTELSSPFTQHIVSAAIPLPKTLNDDSMNNTLLLKMWTKFQNEEI